MQVQLDQTIFASSTWATQSRGSVQVLDVRSNDTVRNVTSHGTAKSFGPDSSAPDCIVRLITSRQLRVFYRSTMKPRYQEYMKHVGGKVAT